MKSVSYLKQIIIIISVFYILFCEFFKIKLLLP